MARPAASCLCVLLLLIGFAPSANGQVVQEREFLPMFTGYTLLYGSGIIMAPHAYTAPGGWQLQLTGGSAFPELGGSVDLDEGASLIFTYRSRAELGVTAYSIKDYGVPLKVIVVPAGPYWPSVAVGALNLLGTSDIGRHGSKGAGDSYDNYFERASPYAVISYAWFSNQLPIATIITAGFGAGHFQVNNGFDSLNGRTGGLFGSAVVDYRAGTDAVIRFAAETDAWDINLAVSMFFRSIQAAVGVLAVEEGSAEDNTYVHSQTRPYISISLNLRELRRWSGGS